MVHLGQLLQSLNTARNELASGCGTQTAALGFGGHMELQLQIH
jgi:hypothetical protein